MQTQSHQRHGSVHFVGVASSLVDLATPLEPDYADVTRRQLQLLHSSRVPDGHGQVASRFAKKWEIFGCLGPVMVGVLRSVHWVVVPC